MNRRARWTTSPKTALVARLEAELADRTFLLVTHRQPMLKLVDRIIILNAGKIAAQGPRDDVLRSMAVGQELMANIVETDAVESAPTGCSNAISPPCCCGPSSR